MGRKIIKIGFVILILISVSFTFATNLEGDENLSKLDSLTNTLNEYSSEIIDLEDLKDDLLKGEDIKYSSILKNILSTFIKEITITLKSSILIVIVLILNAIIKSLELDKGSSIVKTSNLVCFIIVVTICIANYIELLTLFRNTVSTLCKILTIVSPIVLTMLISTGTITTTGIIGPLILFVSSLTGIIINYVVIPFISISLVFKIISSMSEEMVNLNKFSKVISNSAMWIFSITFAIILGLISMLSTVSTSVDEVVLKTTKAAVSVVPVVGKFVADSTEAIMSATELIGKTGGIIGIISLVVVAIIPIIKLLVSYVTYNVTSAVSETLKVNEGIGSIISDFAGQYKILIGMLLGVMAVFIISLGIVVSLMGKVVG